LRFFFSTLPHWLMGALMLAGVSISFANVIARYLFGAALFWAEEVLVFMMIWGVFLGTVAAAYNREHLCMDLFSAGGPGGRLGRFLNAAMTLTLLACCGFLVFQSWKVVSLFFQGGSVSVSAGVPKWIPHAAIPVGFALTAVAVLARLRLYLTGKC
jgi:TRAP-type C4-dicarboxylate transport system permease small subunit